MHIHVYTGTTNCYTYVPFLWISEQALFYKFLKALGVIFSVIIAIEVSTGLQGGGGVLHCQHQYLYVRTYMYVYVMYI